MTTPEHKSRHGIEDLLFAFQKKIFDAIRKEMRDMNCSVPQIELLRYLSEKEHISLSDTAKLLSVAKPSATVMIDGMERRGMVKRTVPASDRRSVIITLTPKSRKLIRTIEEKKKKLIAVLLKKMDQREQEALKALLEKLLTQ